jgi:hypothetical protein
MNFLTRFHGVMLRHRTTNFVFISIFSRGPLGKILTLPLAESMHGERGELPPNGDAIGERLTVKGVPRMRK